MDARSYAHHFSENLTGYPATCVMMSEVLSKFETSVVFPLIKKVLLYKEDFNNYCPVSNIIIIIIL